jgi:2-oxoisovalerate dehydrogenase E1 component
MDGIDASLEQAERHFTAAVCALRGNRAEPAAAEPGAGAAAASPVTAGSALTGARCLDLFDAQLASRHLDPARRATRATPVSRPRCG